MLARTLLDVASKHLDWALPGYTHLQRAQPVYLSHHLLAYVWMLVRDRERFRFAARQADVLPLGAGALAGESTSTPIARSSRATSASPAWCRTRSTPSPTATSPSISCRPARVLSTHLSRLGAEIVLWSSSEFGFMELSDAWSSGSSLMPQKKNPDCGELLRGKAPRVVGHLAALHGVMHALPLTYNKDLQEDKEHVFDAVDTVERLPGRRKRHACHGDFPPRGDVRRQRPTRTSPRPTSPTGFVKRGLPFRESHGVVAGIVRTAVESGRDAVVAVARGAARATASCFDESIYAIFEQSAWLESKVSLGGTSLARVNEQLQQARAVLGPLARRRRR